MTPEGIQKRRVRRRYGPPIEQPKPRFVYPFYHAYCLTNGKWCILGPAFPIDQKEHKTESHYHRACLTWAARAQREYGRRVIVLSENQLHGLRILGKALSCFSIK